MFQVLRSALSSRFGAFLPKNPAQQFAALCHRDVGGSREVLFITSSNGRWILPKGWPIAGYSGAETAAQEAWEEAGVKPARINTTPLGTFKTIKRFDNGAEVPCSTTVYEIAVADLADDYPEVRHRDRLWVDMQDAAEMVEELDLRAILTSFATRDATATAPILT